MRMAGYTNPNTLAFEEKIGNKELMVLIDGGTIHNFIQDRLVNFLGLQSSESNNFHVMVGNRE